MERSEDLLRAYRRALDRVPIWQIGLLAALVFSVPLVVRSPYYLSVLIMIALHSTVVSGLLLLIGCAGQLSLAQASFYGLGAYGSGLLQVKLGLPVWASMPLAVLLTCLVAAVVGIPTLRLRENYLALATLGLAVIIHVLMVEWRGLTGGPSGLLGIRNLEIGGFVFDSDLKVYYLAWALALAALLVSRNLVQSRTGRALQALKGSEVAAEAMGVDAYRLKLQVFTLSAGMAAAAGAVYAHYVAFISPEPFFVSASITFIVMAVVGGLYRIWGALAGTVLVTALGEVLHDVIPLILPSARGEVQMVFFGLILVAVLILLPRGVTGHFPVRAAARPGPKTAAGRGGE